MSNLPKPISNYIERFENLHRALNLNNADSSVIEDLIINNKAQLNNLLMAGLGACTLLLRLGAVINLSIKLDEGSDDEDVILLKQILDNIREILPTDTNWKNILKITSSENSPWYPFVNSNNSKPSVFEKFVSFRNNFVHEIISLRPIDSKKILSGIQTLKEISNNVSPIFNNTELKEFDGEYNFIIKGNGIFNKDQMISLHPFVQKGENDNLPYIFQGLYNNKKTAELISTFYGDIQEQEGSKHYSLVFDPILFSLKGGAGKVFNHSERISYYNEYFVGREKEVETVLSWIKDNKPKNILPIFSNAGMGKGALIANIISKIEEFNIPVLFHFCSSGIANNLQAILYHLILQGKKQQIWKLENNEVYKSLKKLPSKYPQLINLFHDLIDNHFVITRKNTYESLLIIIDGLDEAAVTYPELNIIDFFFQYDEKGEKIDKWNSKQNIKWIFTYREGFYKFPNLETIEENSLIQPLQGLESETVFKTLEEFSPSIEFIRGVIEKGEVSE